MITDLGILTIVINLIAIAFATQYSRSDTFREALLWLVWDLPGMRFVWEKIHPPSEKVLKRDYKPPSTISVWIFGVGSLYIAFYGMVSARYENAVDKIENRMNTFITQLAVVKNPEVRRSAFKEISEIQQMTCPVKPIFNDPSTVLLSLVKNATYSETITVLTRTVEKYRDNLKDANLVGANLKGAWMFKANLKDANLEDANLEGAEMIEANLEGARLEDANLEGAWMIEANLKGANLEVARLEGAWMIQANLEGARMFKANLEGATLTFANLEGVRLNEANLRGASMHVSKLKGADMMGANLKGADFYEANLEGADLSEADLEGAYLVRANLKKAIGIGIKQLCSAKAIFMIKIDSRIERQVRQHCPEKLEAAE